MILNGNSGLFMINHGSFHPEFNGIIEKQPPYCKYNLENNVGTYSLAENAEFMFSLPISKHPARKKCAEI